MRWLLRLPSCYSHTLFPYTDLAFPRVFQLVSAYVTRSVDFFLSPNKCLLLLSPVCECALLSRFRCLDKSLPLPSLGSECAPLSRFHSGFLTNPSLCRLQLVSAPCLVDFIRCAHKSLLLPSPGSECALLGRFLLVS